MSMPIIKLERFCQCPEMGTFGRLSIDSGFELRAFSAFTIERAWLDNQPEVSCIPLGRYALKLGHYNRGNYAAYVVQNDPPSRSMIKIHRANLASEVMGCIGLGRVLTSIAGQWAVGHSERAYEDFMEAMDGCEETELRISQVGGAL